MVGFNRRNFRTVEIFGDGVIDCLIEFDGFIWHVFQEHPKTIIYGKPEREVLFASTSLVDCEKWAQARLPIAASENKRRGNEYEKRHNNSRSSCKACTLP